MKIVCQCDYCGMRDTKDKIEVHESTCVRNAALHACYTCKNKKDLCLTKFECKKDVQIPEGQYMMNCPQWESKEDPYDSGNPLSSLFGDIFGGFPHGY